MVNEKTKINNNILTPDQLEKEIATLTENLQHARDIVATKITPRAREDILPQDILDLIKTKNAVRKRWQRLKQPADNVRVQELQVTIREKIKIHKNEVWTDTLHALSIQDNSLWRLTRRLKSKFNPVPSFSAQPQNNSEKANFLAANLANNSSGAPNTTQEQNNITDAVNKFLSRKYPIPPPQLRKLALSPRDIKNIINKLPNNKAPGKDGLPNILIKNIPKKCLVQITHITNAIILLQHFPTQWKNAIVVPILKPSKDPLNPNSYRPISLLNSLSKVVERALLRRLNTLGLQDKIPAEQFGFRPGHSTTLLAAKIVQDAVDKFNVGQTTFLAALDIERAFDSVWHNGLTYKLIYHHELPPYIITLIHSYIARRSFQVKIEGSLSLPHKLRAGVPQGTVLSPILYNLFIADIPKFPNTKIALFADDALLYAHSFHASAAKSLIQRHLHTLLTWYSKWKINVNIGKCETMVLTRKYTNIRVPVPLKINNHTIPVKRKMKYLGIYLDTYMHFNPHVSYIIQKSFIAMKNLYSLISPRSPLSLQNKLLIYKQIIRPILLYAAPVWCSISNTQMHRLQVMQNRVLRNITAMGRYARINDMHALTDVQKMQDTIYDISDKFYRTKIQYSTLTRNLTRTRHDQNNTNKHKPIYNRLAIYNEPYVPQSP